MLHLPILRWGVPYRSVNQVVTPHFRTREPFVSMSQANLGLIRRDLLLQGEKRATLQRIPYADLVAMAGRAAEHFLNDTLPLDPESGTTQTPQEYVEQVSATTGAPFSNVRRNMLKVHGVLSKVEEVLAGLTRGLDLQRARRGLRPGQWADAQLLRPRRCDGRRAAEQLAGRAFAVGAGHRAEDAAGAQARQRRAVDAAAHDLRVGQGRRAGRRVCLLPDRPCRRQRDPALDRPRHGVRRCRLDQALEVERPRRSPRPGLQQGRDRPRPRRPVGAVHRRDRRVDVEQRRPLVRQRLGRLGHQARRCDRRGARDEAGDDGAALGGRSGGGAGAVCRSRRPPSAFPRPSTAT